MELIDKAALMKYPIRINHYDKEHGNERFVLGIESVLEFAEQLPLIDAAEVRHGTWVEAKQGEMPLYPDGQKMCSECKTIMPSQWVNMPPYCFGCGAKMDGRRESEGT